MPCHNKGNQQRDLAHTMATPPDLLHQAFHEHRAGRLKEAERLYQQVVQASPNRDDILCQLGLLAHQDGRPTDALQWIERAVHLNPSLDNHFLQANLLQSLQRLNEALSVYQHILHLDATQAEAHYNCGIILQQQGKLAEAAQAYQTALHHTPDAWEIHLNLGAILHEQEHLDEAATTLRKAIDLNPTCAEAYNNLALVLKDLDQHSEAIRLFNKALQLNPEYVDAYFNLGQLLNQNNRPHESVVLYERGISLRPNDAAAYLDLAGFYQTMNWFEKAERAYWKNIELQPDSLIGYTNLGFTLRVLKRLDEAMAAYQKAYALFKEPIPSNFTVPFFQKHPEIVQLKFNEAVIHLLKGEYKEGWELFDWRFDDSSPMREFPQPLWDGTPQPDKTLFIWAEQGIGDSIQFLRFLHRVKPLVGKVIVEIQPPLLPLLKGREDIDILFGKGAEDPQRYNFDLHLPLQSLARIFQADLTTLPDGVHYLQPDPMKAAAWRKRIEGAPGLKVGFVWSSNPLCKDFQRRSCQLDYFYPLFDLPGISWFSLQKGTEPTEEQLAYVADKPVTFIGHEFQDFGDTAAAMANLDLVISVDTSVPHLAGALGIPVWTLIAHSADWRWLQGRTDTPWYPSMRLFRQKTLSDWKNLLLEVKTALMDYLNP